MVKILTSIALTIDRITEVIGKSLSMLSILMVIVTFSIVVARYVFDTGSIAVQESIIYMNALLFMLCAGFTLKHNGHVRVDVFYSKASPRYKAWADLAGTLCLLMPVSIFLFVICFDYVSAAWAIHETSGEAGGLPYVYLLKSLMLGMCIVLILQGSAEIIRNLCILFFPDSPLAATHNEEEVGNV